MKYLKTVNLRRLALNIGLVFLLLAVQALIYQLYDSSFYSSADGVISGCKTDQKGWDVIHSDGRTEHHTGAWFNVTYTASDGKQYTDKIYGSPGSYAVGEHIAVNYDRRVPAIANNYPDSHMHEVLLFTVLGAFLVCGFAGEFRGYAKDFVKRYKKSFVFTVISIFLPAAYYYTRVLHPAPQFMFEGLGEYITFMFLLFLMPVLNIIVWLAATVHRYKLSIRQENTSSA